MIHEPEHLRACTENAKLLTHELVTRNFRNRLMPQHAAPRFGSIPFAVVFGALAWTAAIPGASHAQDAWLDEAEPAGWNEAGKPVPDAPARVEHVDPRCPELARPPELEQDSQVVDTGWELVGAYQGGWDTLVIRGTANYGGMCRPWQYQAFVFVDGVFAGTLSPETMDSRTDGAIADVWIQDAERITAQYMRYTDEDPLCCPSRTTTVEFVIAQTDEGPVVRPTSMYTTPTSNR